MNTMFYVVCIVAIVLAANTVQQYLKLRHHKENRDTRIKVLERIVTENKFDLRQEINKL
jgi:hypothetical protein